MSANNIPSDIQEEIIIRLPVKSLVRFRSVSKAWKSLIDSSEFIAAYSLRHTQPHHLLISYRIRDWQETRRVKYSCFVDDDTFPQRNCVPTVSSLVEIPDNDGSIKLGSSHGLVCFFCYFFQGNPQATAVLWNPSVNKSIAVVVPYVLRSPIPSVVGFGVCPHTGDPKLVKVTSDNPYSETGHMPWHVMVFSVSSKKWTIPSCNKPPRRSLGFTWSQATIGQFIYFLTYDRWKHGAIMSFDMSIEEFIEEVKLPSCLARTCFTSLSIYRLRDSLALVDRSTIDLIDITTRQVFVVWMMKHGDPGSFTKLYTIKSPHTASIQTPLGFRKSGEPIINMISYHDDSQSQSLAVYEPSSEHFQDLGISVNRFHTFVNSYMESLLLLNEEDECIYFPVDDGLVAKRGGVKR